MAYRGDEEASAERLAALDEEIAGLEAKLTEVFWEHVAPVWRVSRELPWRLGPLEARHERIAELTRVLERARHGPDADPDLPAAAPPPQGLLADVGRALSFMPQDIVEGFLSVVRPHEPEPTLVHREGRTWGVRFRGEGAPIELRLAYEGGRDGGYFVTIAETTIAPAARLDLKPEGILQDLLEMMGMRREIELDDPAFDPVFIIGGDEATARAYLTAEVRRALLVIGEEFAPVVTLAGGRARVRTNATSRRAVSRVVQVLMRWHAMPSPRPLLREP